jgi:outer membrane protein OmpA-like peptidoglycan-associated protein
MKPSHNVPATRVRVPAPAPAIVLDSHNYEQDKNRIKQALAINSSGSMTSADVGYYMDVLQGRLKQAAGGNIGIGRQGDRIVLDLTGRMAFDPGSTQISAGNLEILRTLSRVLVEYRMTLVSVQVRTDDPSTHVIDPHRSEEHAQAIAHDLVNAGVGTKRIVIAGVGPEKNVRVALTLEPIVRSTESSH